MTDRDQHKLNKAAHWGRSMGAKVASAGVKIVLVAIGLAMGAVMLPMIGIFMLFVLLVGVVGGLLAAYVTVRRGLSKVRL